jgi:hypothetical protein
MVIYKLISLFKNRKTTFIFPSYSKERKLSKIRSIGQLNYPSLGKQFDKSKINLLI